MQCDVCLDNKRSLDPVDIVCKRSKVDITGESQSFTIFDHIDYNDDSSRVYTTHTKVFNRTRPLFSNKDKTHENEDASSPPAENYKIRFKSLHVDLPVSLYRKSLLNSTLESIMHRGRRVQRELSLCLQKMDPKT